jgi:hypothetical protein
MYSISDVIKDEKFVLNLEKRRIIHISKSFLDEDGV